MAQGRSLRSTSDAMDHSGTLDSGNDKLSLETICLMLELDMKSSLIGTSHHALKITPAIITFCIRDIYQINSLSLNIYKVVVYVYATLYIVHYKELRNLQ